MTRRLRRRSPLLRLLVLGLLALCLIGNGWTSATAAMPVAGDPCPGMMSAGGHGECCDHGRPGKPMPADCLEHCYLLGQMGASAPLPAVPALGFAACAQLLPVGSLAAMHLPARLAPALRPPISA